MRHSLYKYYSERKWAEAFLDGKILFRSLSYFRDCEDSARGDEYEGTSTFLPDGGLIINNQTQGTTFGDPRAFESTVKAGEIFVFCASRSLSEEIAREFKAVVCVEILKISTLCARIQAALPPTATCRGRKVEYYKQSEAGHPRWALPDDIATSKLDSFASQDEYRLVFSLTDALAFEKVGLRLVQRNVREAAKPAEHHEYLVKARSLRDICKLHECHPV